MLSSSIFIQNAAKASLFLRFNGISSDGLIEKEGFWFRVWTVPLCEVV
jgi:hypothetical protein